MGRKGIEIKFAEIDFQQEPLSISCTFYLGETDIFFRFLLENR